MSNFAIAKYWVTIGRLRMPGMGTDPDKWCAAGIRCIQATAGDFLDVAFMPEGLPLPANTSVGKWHTSYRPMSELQNYIDLLRNESPLLMSLDPARPEGHTIGTSGPEGVGEGE